MKKTIYFFCLLSLILIGSNLRAQSLNFTLSPQNQCYSAGNNTAIAYVTTGVSGATTYSWSITSPSNCVASVSTFSNGMIASISYPCCGVYTIYCFAYGSGTVILGYSVQNATVGCSTPISVSSFPNQGVCAGTTVLLHATGLNNYTWTPGNFYGDSIYVSPTSTTCYTVTGTSSSGCTSSAVKCVTVTPSNSVSISSGANSICSGSFVPLYASGATSYTWLPGGSNSPTITPSPSVSTCYTLMGNSCGGLTYAVKCITVNPTPILSVSGSTTVCSGQPSTYYLSGGTSYTWLPSMVTGSVVTLTPTASTCYSIASVNSSGCYGVTGICINVSGTGAPLSVSGGGTICAGSSATLVASGAQSYTWIPGGLTGSVIAVTPSVTTCYTVAGSSGSGCFSYGAVCVVVQSSSPGVSINGGLIPLCAGSSTYLTASGASSYTWLPGGSTASVIAISPSVTSCYTLVGSGCSGISSAVRCITVVPSPVLSVTGNTSVCSGGTASLTAFGASNFAWLTPSGLVSGQSIVVSPTVNSCYYAFGNNSFGCEDSAAICVYILGGNLSVSGNSVICAGSSTTLSASGAQSYTWLPGNLSGSSIVVTPSVSTCYTVIGTNAYGCTSYGLKCITVNPKPTITTFGTPGSSCAGSSYTLSASGASSYTWIPFNLTGANIVITPTTSICYTVIGMNSSYCTNTATSCFSVLPSSSITILGSNLICAGAPTTLTATGAQNYTWFPSNTVGSALTVSPSAASCYTVIGTNANGCISSAVKCLSVQTGPTITASGSTSLCAGSTTTLFANGAQSYTWLPGNIAGAVVAVTPSVSTCYTVVGTNANGCVGLTSVCVQLLPRPNITSSGGYFCLGNPGNLYAQGASTYTWLPGNLTGSVISVSPGASGCFTVLGTNTSGCTNSGLSCFSVVPSPDITVSGYNSICAGNTTTLSASGASSYTWSPGGSTAASIVVSPSVNTCYTVTGVSNTTGCMSKTVKCITVYASPVISVSGNGLLCSGSSANYLVSGANTYTWSNGSNSPLQTLSPSVSTCYTVNGTSVQGCIGSAVKCISVVPLPSVNVNPNTTICFGSAVTLVASGASSYSWNTGATASVIVVSPTISTIYTVIGSNGTCSTTRTVGVTVNQRPTINIFNSDSTLCPGNTTTLSAAGASSYTWSNGGAGASIVISPTVTTSYTVSGTAANGCSNSNAIVVHVMNCTGLDQHTASVEVKMYPNPNSGQLTLQGNGVNRINFKVYDLLGRELMSGSFTDNKTLDLSSYSNGTYVVRFESGSLTNYQKVVLEK